MWGCGARLPNAEYPYMISAIYLKQVKRLLMHAIYIKLVKRHLAHIINLFVNLYKWQIELFIIL